MTQIKYGTLENNSIQGVGRGRGTLQRKPRRNSQIDEPRENKVELLEYSTERSNKRRTEE